MNHEGRMMCVCKIVHLHSCECDPYIYIVISISILFLRASRAVRCIYPCSTYGLSIYSAAIVFLRARAHLHAAQIRWANTMRCDDMLLWICGARLWNGATPCESTGICSRLSNVKCWVLKERAQLTHENNGTCFFAYRMCPCMHMDWKKNVLHCTKWTTFITWDFIPSLKIFITYR